MSLVFALLVLVSLKKLSPISFKMETLSVAKAILSSRSQFDTTQCSVNAFEKQRQNFNIHTLYACRTKGIHTLYACRTKGWFLLIN